MTISQAAQRLYQSKLSLTLAVLVGAVLAMGASFVRPIEYSTTSTFIVIQEQRFSDPYAQARSAEYLAGILARIVDTDTFRSSVFARTPEVRRDLPAGEQDLRKRWSSDVEVRTVADSGILSVSAYHANPAAARALVEAIGAALINDAGTYLGSASSIKLLQIDGPVTSQFPVRPNLPANVLAGALVGFVVAGAWILARKQRAVRLVPPAVSTPTAPRPPLGGPSVSFDRWLRNGTPAA